MIARRIDKWGMWHVWRRGGFWWGNLREGDYLKDTGMDGMRGMNWIDLAEVRDR
jgi:hypothetical protein